MIRNDIHRTLARDPPLARKVDMSAREYAASRMLRTRPKGARLLNAALAAIGGSGAILAAAVFWNQSPLPVPPPPDKHVDAHGLTKAARDPQWSVLRLGTAATPRLAYSDPVPARVRIDETSAARVGSPLAGRVTKVWVELGQRVKKGDRLFAVASGALPSLRAALEDAEVDVEVASAQYRRVHDMVTARLLPGKEELAAAAQKRESELAQRAAQSKLKALRVAPTKDDNEFTVIAPCDGVIVDKSVLPAQEVDSDTTLIQIADVTTVWVVADLFESDAAEIEPGTDARITVPALPGYSVDATVETVSAVVDPERHSVPVRVRLPNADGRLKPNQYAEMRLRVKPPGGSAEIAASALVSDGATQYVYAQEAPGKLVRRTVVAGPMREGRVVILSGLKVGETVVEQGGILLDNQIELAH